MTLRVWRSQREAVVDVAVAAVAAALAIAATTIGASYRPALPGFVLTIDWAGNALQVAAAALLLLRRRLPLTVTGAILALSALLTLYVFVHHGSTAELGTTLLVPVSAPFATGSAALHSTHRWRAWALTGALTAVAARPWERSPTVVLTAVLFIAVPALVGMYVAARRRLVQALVERAERAERERRLEAERARADERARLAGEMHDVVTHQVSLMVLQAGALGVTAPDEATRQAAEDLREMGCHALDELRDLVGILRAPVPAQETARGHRSEAVAPELERLVAESESVGVPVELVQEGSPVDVSPVVGRTAYRVVQEALTNVHKHATGAAVRVLVRYGPDRVLLTVRNGAPAGPVDGALTARGSGSGLLGLRQRLVLVGGTLQAGPTPGGGFEVTATLPTYVPTAESAP